MTDKADEAGRVRRPVTAALLVALLTLSALTLIEGRTRQAKEEEAGTETARREREATIEDYRSFGATLLAPAFGKFTLVDITNTAIANLYRDMRKRKHSPYTIAKAHVLLTNIFKLAARRGLILSSPMNLVDSPETPELNPIAMDEDQVKMFLLRLHSSIFSHPRQLLHQLAARTKELKNFGI